MIHLSDSIGLSAFTLSTGAHDAAALLDDPLQAPAALNAEFLADAMSIGSDVSAAVRGFSVTQHAANVLSHLVCHDVG